MSRFESFESNVDDFHKECEAIKRMKEIQEKKEKEPKELTFTERNDLFMRYDKLTSAQRSMVIMKHMGAMSILCDDPVYWSKFEEYLTFYESRQPNDSLTFMETVEKITRKYYPLDLTGGGKTDNL